jgi:eukaryotic-like serine/threonine-protein kinase
MSDGAPQLQVLAGRYVLGEVIGRGGAATVHLGKAVDTRRRGVVAIKKLHPHLASDPAFVAMMLDEARLLSRVRHDNVVATLEVVMDHGELYLVMEYVHSATLSSLLAAAHRKGARPPIPVASAIVLGALCGLHAAHEARGAAGEPLGVVHRDVSPQNLLVAESGAIKVVDFGIAKAEGRVLHTQDGSIKGKLGYMPPEQLFGEALDRRADVYAAGVLLWETLVGERLFAGQDGGPALVKSLVSMVAPPSDRRPDVSEALDRVVARALAHDRSMRFETAQVMAEALRDASPPATPAEVGAWVRSLAGDTLDERGARLFVFDQASRDLVRDLARQRETLASIPGANEPSRRRWALAIAAALCTAAGGSAAAILTAPDRSPGTADAATTAASTAETADAAPAETADAATTAGEATSSGGAVSTAASSGEAPPVEVPGHRGRALRGRCGPCPDRDHGGGRRG